MADLERILYGKVQLIQYRENFAIVSNQDSVQRAVDSQSRYIAGKFYIVKYDIRGIISLAGEDILKIMAWLSNPNEVDEETKNLFSIVSSEPEKIPLQTHLYRVVYERLA
jgi:hypothetical protein